MKVLFLANIPSPYRVDFFNELGKKCKLTVAFEGIRATDRDSKWVNPKIKHFRAVFLKGIRTKSDQFLCFDVIPIIREPYDHIIVGGYSTPTGILAIEYMRFHKIPFWIEADGGLISQDNVVKFLVKKHLISSASTWFSSGKKTTEYLIHYGANPDSIKEFPFSSVSQRDILPDICSMELKQKYRRELGLMGDKIVISVGKFKNNDGYRKGFDILLRAFAQCPTNYQLYIVGDTPTRDFLDLKESLGMNNVHFLEFMAKDILKKVYCASDVFCLQTREDIWGLVINEAMAAGLPVITTNMCVAGMELVEEGITGYIVPTEDEHLLAKRITDLLEDDDLRESMGRNGLKKICYWTIENMAEQHYKELIYTKCISLSSTRA